MAAGAAIVDSTGTLTHEPILAQILAHLAVERRAATRGPAFAAAALKRALEAADNLGVAPVGRMVEE